MYGDPWSAGHAAVGSPPVSLPLLAHWARCSLFGTKTKEHTGVSGPVRGKDSDKNLRGRKACHYTEARPRKDGCENKPKDLFPKTRRNDPQKLEHHTPACFNLAPSRCRPANHRSTSAGQQSRDCPPFCSDVPGIQVGRAHAWSSCGSSFFDVSGIYCRNDKANEEEKYNDKDQASEESPVALFS